MFIYIKFFCRCENGANCPVCRRTFQLSEVSPINAATDADITAIAKAISEQVPVATPEIQPLQEFRNIVHLAPIVPILSFHNPHPTMPYIHNPLLTRSSSESDSSSDPESFNGEPTYNSDHSDYNEIFIEIGSSHANSDYDDFNDYNGVHDDLTEEFDDNQSVGSSSNADVMSDYVESEQIYDLNDDDDDDDNAESEYSAVTFDDDHENIDNDGSSDNNVDINVQSDDDAESNEGCHYSDDFDDVNDDFQDDFDDYDDNDDNNYWDDWDD